MKKILDEYKDFVNKGNVVTIAVGLVMALYFKVIIDAIVDGVIMPIVSAIFGKTDFTQIGFDIGDARISIGLVIQAVIVFFIVAWRAVPHHQAVQPLPGQADGRGRSGHHRGRAAHRDPRRAAAPAADGRPAAGSATVGATTDPWPPVPPPAQPSARCDA